MVVVVDGMCSAVGIHHLPFARCAGLTAGDVMVTAAIGANAIGRRAPGRSVPRRWARPGSRCQDRGAPDVSDPDLHASVNPHQGGVGEAGGWTGEEESRAYDLVRVTRPAQRVRGLLALLGRPRLRDVG